jgi:ABC-type Fe3+/spermidine/putrescine transport system ATPase subunit
MLRVEGIYKKYGDNEVLKDVSLEIGEEIKVLIGINGCGKSTLLKIIAGIITANKGKVELNENDITTLPPEGRHVGYVPQHPALFNNKNVINNIRYGMRNGRGNDEFVAKIIEMLGLKKMVMQKPNELSGGYKSRVSLARALAPQPEIILLDEPLSDIDVVVKDKLLPEFRKVLKLLKIPVLYVTHDPDEAQKVGDKFAAMIHGQIHEIASASEAFNLIKESAS